MPRSRAAAASFLRSVFVALFLACGLVPEGRGASERWYTVEVIVFEHTGDANLDDEVWLVDPGLPPIDESVELTDASGLALAGDPGEESASSLYAFQLLDSSHHRLGGVLGRLRSSRDYRPLLHLAWHQPGYSPRRARHAHVQGWKDAETGAGTSRFAARARPAIDGTLRLYRRKFLHLNADLLYYRDDPRPRLDAGAGAAALPLQPDLGEGTGKASAMPGEGAALSSSLRPEEPDSTPDAGSRAAVSVYALPEAPSPAPPVPGETTIFTDPEAPSPEGRGPAGEPGDEPDATMAVSGSRPGLDGPPIAFRMSASRRMRPGELHYLDHPLFGLLVRVTRYAPPAPQPAAPPAAEEALEAPAPSGGAPAAGTAEAGE